MKFNFNKTEKGEKTKLDLKAIGMDKLILMVVAGIVLVWCSIPGDNKKNSNTEEEIVYEYNTDEYERELENRLEDLLERMEGVGAVEVMVTIKSTREKVILMENPYNKSSLNETDAQGGQRISEEESKGSNTVYVTDENGDTVPYVINEIMPEIEGVAVIAKGGDSSAVKEKIINVVKSLFDIDVNKISISKMK